MQIWTECGQIQDQKSVFLNGWELVGFKSGMVELRSGMVGFTLESGCIKV